MISPNFAFFEAGTIMFEEGISVKPAYLLFAKFHPSVPDLKKASQAKQLNGCAVPTGARAVAGLYVSGFDVPGACKLDVDYFNALGDDLL